ncbi:hypothetical protein [Mycoplasmopsis agassizii]|uniref:Lipoprotein n=1 Tax=Mycoplasmopsis agassizii TaxID=33922 RepID=A0ABX4H522_9BACT|nr:hypothetical protein [Mycoplasmopsis agassizii]PAF54989.1 hypothetical protein CJF60_04630 [Mycoplasmopsis agassizii]SMC17635.1 hypothetical protein SAMN02745179_00513 [Mycoplasmopsis agassizii]
MLISSKSKYKKRKAFLILLASSSFLAITATLVACTSKVNIDTPPENKDIPKEPAPLENKVIPKESEPDEDVSYYTFPSWFYDVDNTMEPSKYNNRGILKGSVLYERMTSDNKQYLQINTWNYRDFTFSDFQWIWKDSWKNKKLDKTEKDKNSYYWYPVEFDGSYKLRSEKFIKKWNWEYEPKFVINSNNQYEDFLKPFSEQKPYPNHLKSISLVRNETELKQALRLEENDKEKYLKYFKMLEKTAYYSLNNKPLSDQELSKKYFPWTDSFNFKTINSKMDFEKNNYLFIKDLRATNIYTGKGIGNLSKGIKIHSYKVEPDNKKVSITFSYDKEIDPCPKCPIPESVYSSNAASEWYWKRLSSMFIPIEKNKLNDFNMNDWKIEISFWSPVVY